MRVSADPTFRLIGSPSRWDRGAALTSTLHWFETDLLTGGENLLGLMAVNRELLARAALATGADRVVLDMDSSESPVHGAQEGSAYNGHFESVCYHPLFLFTEHGDCVGATLRPGNVHSADDWDDLLLPEIDRQQGAGRHVAFRADAAFARPAIYEALEQRDVDYAIRMPANKTLELAVEDILFRPPGRPSCKPLVRYKSFRYQAKSWTTARRIVAKVEHHRGELFPRVGFIVTNMTLPSRSVVRFYNKRGTAEQWIKEGKQATHWTRLSCHRFRANEVRLQLSVLAYNLGNLWRRLVLPPRIATPPTSVSPQDRRSIQSPSFTSSTNRPSQRSGGSRGTVLSPVPHRPAGRAPRAGPPPGSSRRAGCRRCATGHAPAAQRRAPAPWQGAGDSAAADGSQAWSQPSRSASVGRVAII